jgi:HEAT repeat protein
LLIECTANPSDALRLNAALALRKAPPTATAEVLDHLLDDPNVRVRLVAAGEVLERNPDHARAAAVVEAARSDPSPRVREAAGDILRSLPETDRTSTEQQPADPPAETAEGLLVAR